MAASYGRARHGWASPPPWASPLLVVDCKQLRWTTLTIHKLLAGGYADHARDHFPAPTCRASTCSAATQRPRHPYHSPPCPISPFTESHIRRNTTRSPPSSSKSPTGVVYLLLTDDARGFLAATSRWTPGRTRWTSFAVLPSARCAAPAALTYSAHPSCLTVTFASGVHILSLTLPSFGS